MASNTLGGGASGPQAFGDALNDALQHVRPVQAMVEAGRIVPHFGKKADAIITSALSQLNEESDHVMKMALDGVLQDLFVRQLALLRAKIVASFVASRGSRALSRSDRWFQNAASQLVRPGSSWNYEEERVALQTYLRQVVQREAELAKERFQGAQMQRTTADVVGRLQKQMDQMGEKLRGSGAGSPWAAWTSYQLPGTPFRVSGRYQQGRANIELTLGPEKDPANAQAGFVDGLSSKNFGVSLNLGV